MKLFGRAVMTFPWPWPQVKVWWQDQELAKHILIHGRKNRDWDKAINPQIYPQWCTFSGKVVPPRGSITPKERHQLGTRFSNT